MSLIDIMIFRGVNDLSTRFGIAMSFWTYLQDLAEISLDLSLLVNQLVPRPGFNLICKGDSLYQSLLQ